MRLAVSLLALALAAGCNRRPEIPVKTAAPVPATAASDAPASVAAAAPQPETVTVSGTVLETMDASDYTYMRLKTASGETWAAVNRTKVAKGDAVTVTNAMVMDGFQSKTLNRTFDRIVFGVLAPAGGAAAPAANAASAPAANAPMMAGHSSGGPEGVSPAEMAAQHGQAAAGPDAGVDAKVEKASGKNAKTVAELWAQRKALKGQEVAVKAKVVKATNGVMGTNWLHVRDGSGSKAAKDNDLTVTTNAVVKVGDVVTLTGVVAIDKDFGAGYAYPVIVENAKVK